MRSKFFLLIVLLILVCSSSFANPFVSNLSVFLGEVASNLTAGQPLSVSTTGKLASGIIETQDISTASTTTTSTASPSTAVIASMTRTPAAGTWEVSFCTTFQSNANNIDILYGIFAGGTLNGAEMSVTPQIQGGLTPSLNQRLPGCAIALVTVNGSQAIEIRWHVSAAGTATAGNRIMTVKRY